MQRKFQGIWIPEALWFTKELTLMEKLFFIEIQSLDNDHGCYASNAHFAEIFDVGKSHCSAIIKSLEAKGWITIELQYRGKLIIKRICRVVDNYDAGVGDKSHTPYVENHLGYVENPQGRYTNPSNTKNKKTKSPTASAVGLVPPAEIYKLANVYLEVGQRKRFVLAMRADIKNIIDLEVVAGALSTLAAKEAFEALTAQDAIAYCKASLYKGSKNEKKTPKAGE